MRCSESSCERRRACRIRWLHSWELSVDSFNEQPSAKGVSYSFMGDVSLQYFVHFDSHNCTAILLSPDIRASYDTSFPDMFSINSQKNTMFGVPTSAYFNDYDKLNSTPK